jgi:hypothetical protein
VFVRELLLATFCQPPPSMRICICVMARPLAAGAAQLKVMLRPSLVALTLGLRTGPYGIAWFDAADGGPS